jgi:hypothetical protein
MLMAIKRILKSMLAMMTRCRLTMPLQVVNQTGVVRLVRLVRLKDNLDWLDKNHKNQFVAIHDKSFLDKDIEVENFKKTGDKRL